MAGFDYEVGYDFVEDAEGFGERFGGSVAVGEEKVFHFVEIFSRELGGE